MTNFELGTQLWILLLMKFCSVYLISKSENHRAESPLKFSESVDLGA